MVLSRLSFRLRRPPLTDRTPYKEVRGFTWWNESGFHLPMISAKLSRREKLIGRLLRPRLTFSVISDKTSKKTLDPSD